MFLEFWSICRFHCFRYWRLHRNTFLIIAVLVIANLALWLTSAQFYFRAESLSDQILLEKQDMRTRKQAVARQTQEPVVLPDFDNAKLVAALHQVADELSLPLDEVSYSLDNSDNQPFLRYHMNLSVVSSYAVMRDFVVRLQRTQSQVSLDGIHCSRDDIGVAALSCDLNLSAFYRKPTGA